MKSEALGVVVVRLQVPELHAGHRYLLNSVTAIHKNVLVVIGETEARLRAEDPLTFEMREEMLKATYPNVHVTRLPDMPDDVWWSRGLDTVIAHYAMNFPVNAEPVLYGGRDSFLKHYHGVFRTFELPPVAPVSGTEVRASVEPKNSTDFRMGMIYAAKHKFPISYQCVDVAIMHGGAVLLGQKKQDNGKWRFIGGFVSPQDASLERAAMREVREETMLEPTTPKYIGSAQIEDHRYPSSGTDRLMTAMFVMTPMFGAASAADDIDAVQWWSLEQIEDVLVREHQVLFTMLKRYVSV